MAKIMIKRHREQRTCTKADRESKKSHHKTDKNASTEKTLDRNEVLLLNLLKSNKTDNGVIFSRTTPIMVSKEVVRVLGE